MEKLTYYSCWITSTLTHFPKYSGLCFVLLGLWVGKIDIYFYKTYFMTARVTMAEPLTFACFQLSRSKYGMLYPWHAPSQPWYMFCDASLF